MNKINDHDPNDPFYQLEHKQHSEQQRSKIFEECLQATIKTNHISSEQFRLLSDSWNLPISDTLLRDKVLDIARQQQGDSSVKDVAELFFHHSYDWGKIKQLMEEGKDRVIHTLNSFPDEVIRNLDNTSKTALVYVAERSCELAKQLVKDRTALEIHEILTQNIFQEDRVEEDSTTNHLAPDIESIAFEVDFDLHIPSDLEHLRGPFRSYLFQNFHLIGIIEKCCNREYLCFEDFLLFEHSNRFFQACLYLTERKGQILYDCLQQEPRLLSLEQKGIITLADFAISFEAKLLFEMSKTTSGLEIKVLENRVKKLLKLNEYQIEYFKQHPTQAPLLDLSLEHICKQITLSCNMGSLLKVTEESRLNQLLNKPKLAAFVINHLNHIPGIDAFPLDQVCVFIEKLQYDIPICRYVIQQQIQGPIPAIINFLDHSKVISALIKLRKTTTNGDSDCDLSQREISELEYFTTKTQDPEKLFAIFNYDQTTRDLLRSDEIFTLLLPFIGHSPETVLFFLSKHKEYAQFPFSIDSQKKALQQVVVSLENRVIKDREVGAWLKLACLAKKSIAKVTSWVLKYPFVKMVNSNLVDQLNHPFFSIVQAHPFLKLGLDPKSCDVRDEKTLVAAANKKLEAEVDIDNFLYYGDDLKKWLTPLEDSLGFEALNCIKALPEAFPLLLYEKIPDWMLDKCSQTVLQQALLLVKTNVRLAESLIRSKKPIQDSNQYPLSIEPIKKPPLKLPTTSSSYQLSLEMAKRLLKENNQVDFEAAASLYHQPLEGTIDQIKHWRMVLRAIQHFQKDLKEVPVGNLGNYLLKKCGLHSPAQMLLSAILINPRQPPIGSCFVSSYIIQQHSSPIGLLKIIKDYKKTLLRSEKSFGYLRHLHPLIDIHTQVIIHSRHGSGGEITKHDFIQRLFARFGPIDLICYNHARSLKKIYKKFQQRVLTTLQTGFKGSYWTLNDSKTGKNITSVADLAHIITELIPSPTRSEEARAKILQEVTRALDFQKITSKSLLIKTSGSKSIHNPTEVLVQCPALSPECVLNFLYRQVHLLSKPYQDYIRCYPTTKTGLALFHHSISLEPIHLLSYPSFDKLETKLKKGSEDMANKKIPPRIKKKVIERYTRDQTFRSLFLNEETETVASFTKRFLEAAYCFEGEISKKVQYKVEKALFQLSPFSTTNYVIIGDLNWEDVAHNKANIKIAMAYSPFTNCLGYYQVTLDEWSIMPLSAEFFKKPIRLYCDNSYLTPG